MHILSGQWFKVVSSLKAAVLITHVRYILADLGKPLVIVTDNGRQFASDQFNDFRGSNGIRHLYTPPWHPSLNGWAEHTVQTAKKLMFMLLLLYGLCTHVHPLLAKPLPRQWVGYFTLMLPSCTLHSNYLNLHQCSLQSSNLENLSG
ncbi:hypothetical protein PR048_000857 [Dryococelus australis]|uniref:Integrase catalytic domain-containing protein n=1 Tax=Dryococelus australis TaxID=614101 RepID=A0ABQ9IGN9_9NEOP|nr:hypothetical protein PR048_000857 [Dryococelus australis]